MNYKKLTCTIYRPIKRPTCLTAMKTDSTAVLSSTDVTRAISATRAEFILEPRPNTKELYIEIRLIYLYVFARMCECVCECVCVCVSAYVPVCMCVLYVCWMCNTV